MRRTGVLLIALALAAAACGDSDNTDPTTSTAPPTTTSSTTSTSTSSTTSPSTTIAAPDEQFVNVYFLVESADQAGGPFLGPVARPVEPTVAVGRAAVNALIAGPTADERAQAPSISGGLPDRTRLLGLTIADGTARVDLSQEIENVGGTFGELSVLAQLTYTLTQFPTVDEVVLLIEGKQVEFYGGHGFDVTPSLNRDTFVVNEGVLGEILIDAPGWWARTDNPLLVKGIARAFEGTVQYGLYDGDGLPLREGFTTADAGPPDFGTFQFAIPYEVDVPQLGSLILWEQSAKDGSPINIVEHAIWLSPAT